MAALLKEAANKAAVKLGYPLGLKKEQLDVVVAFMSGKDVFAVLPTGYGKSLCYAFAFKEFDNKQNTPYYYYVEVIPDFLTG